MYLESKVFEDVRKTRFGFIAAAGLDEESDGGGWLAVVDSSNFYTVCVDSRGK